MGPVTDHALAFVCTVASPHCAACTRRQPDVLSATMRRRRRCMHVCVCVVKSFLLECCGCRCQRRGPSFGLPVRMLRRGGATYARRGATQGSEGSMWDSTRNGGEHRLLHCRCLLRRAFAGVPHRHSRLAGCRACPGGARSAQCATMCLVSGERGGCKAWSAPSYPSSPLPPSAALAWRGLARLADRATQTFSVSLGPPSAPACRRQRHARGRERWHGCVCPANIGRLPPRLRSRSRTQEALDLDDDRPALRR